MKKLGMSGPNETFPDGKESPRQIATREERKSMFTRRR